RICVEVDPANVAPTPPGGGPSSGPNRGSVFLSYKLKCGKQSAHAIALADDFGAGSFVVGRPDELLVPALPGPSNDPVECYKTKDARRKATYTLDLVAGVGGFSDQRGCTVKLGAKKVCVPVTEQTITPTPPGGGPGAGALVGTKLLEYKLKCPKHAVSPM